MTRNVKKYLALKHQLEDEIDDSVQSRIEEELDELYFELSNEEIAEIEEEELD